MSSPKRQHYLPELYLEGFCRSGRLWIYDRENRKFREQTPVNTAVRSYYYSFTDGSGVRNAVIERMLSRVESEAKPCLAKLRAGDPLSLEERQKVALFIAFLRTRVPEFHEFVQEIHGKLTAKRMQLLARTPGAFECIMNRLAKERTDRGEPISEDPVSPEQLREFIERGEYDITVDRTASLQSMMYLSFGFAKVLTAGKWGVLRSPEDTFFVTSDNPVVPRYPPKALDAIYGVGFASPEVTKFVPIASDMMLMVGGIGKEVMYRLISKPDVHDLNVFVAKASTFLLIGQDRAALDSIVSAAQIHGPTQRERVRVG